jgi:hypothetical protein
MTLWVLDTDSLSSLERGNSKIQELQSQVNAGGNFGYSQSPRLRESPRFTDGRSVISRIFNSPADRESSIAISVQTLLLELFARENYRCQ